MDSKTREKMKSYIDVRSLHTWEMMVSPVSLINYLTMNLMEDCGWVLR